MPIHPLPQFEADLEADRKAYEALQPPKSIVVRYGSMKLVGEFPFDAAANGNVKPGCGSKLVVRTPRGTELGEMLTTTCPNSGCSKSVSRQEMLRYIDNSGGRDYPFATDGRVLRVATAEDLDHQARLEQSKHALKLEARDAVERLGLSDRMKIVEVEPILGGERLIVHYLAEERIDYHEFLREFGRAHHVRIDMHQVGARDEARLAADYERCGQYCCCKNFLKVLKPVSMRSAKTQKATLDPLKISGRCGRLMCCLRYEDETYEDLKKRLPRRKQRVGTPEGDGIVLDTQILTQLALVLIEATGKQVAIPVEELTPPSGPPPAAAPPPPDGARAAPPAPGSGAPPSKGGKPRDAGPAGPRPRVAKPAPVPPPPQPPRDATPPARPDRDDGFDDIETDSGEDAAADAPRTPGSPGPSGPPAGPTESMAERRRRRRRRRRRPPGTGDAGAPPGESPGGPPSGPPTVPSPGDAGTPSS